MQYVQQALNEIQLKSGDQKSREFLNVEADVRYYSMPTSQVKLDGVYAKSVTDSTQWVKIARVQSVDMLENSDTSSASSDDNIIII